MVVASDGVWEFLSSEDVVEIVKGCAGDADRVCSFCLSRHVSFVSGLRQLSRDVKLDGTTSSKCGCSCRHARRFVLVRTGSGELKKRCFLFQSFLSHPKIQSSCLAVVFML